MFPSLQENILLAKLQQFYRLQPQLRPIFQVFRVLSLCTVHLKALSVCIQFYTFLYSLDRLWPILQAELADLAFEIWKHCCRDWLLKERRHFACCKGFQSSLISNISRKQIILITWLISSGQSLKQIHTDKSREVNSVNCVCILYLLSSEYCSGYLWAQWILRHLIAKPPTP